MSHSQGLDQHRIVGTHIGGGNNVRVAPYNMTQSIELNRLFAVYDNLISLLHGICDISHCFVAGSFHVQHCSCLGIDLKSVQELLRSEVGTY